MSRTSRSSTHRKGHKPHFSRTMLLPLAATEVHARSLKFHACLMTVRKGFGDAEHLADLARVMYLAYFLQRAGYGRPPFDQFHDAEQYMAQANRRGVETDAWFLDEDGYPLFEAIVSLHDRQLAEAPTHAILAAEGELIRFIAGARPSPLPPCGIEGSAGTKAAA